MRWLLDQGLPRSSAKLLRDAGHDAVHVGDVDMAAASDLEILQYASRDLRCIVTLDADFHSILATAQASHPSVIRVREEGLKADVVTKLLLHIHSRFASELLSGCVISCHNWKVRIKKLPIC